MCFSVGDTWRGIPPGYIAKLSESQRKFILTGTGREFYWKFLTAHGKHLFIFGTTGSGKTNKGYAMIDWLKHLETQIWMSSGKMGETLPLLCMGKQVDIIVPDGCDVRIEERINGKWKPIENHPDVIPVSSPRDMLASISQTWSASNHQSFGKIAILETRNAFSRRVEAVKWNAEFFEILASEIREGHLNKILPASLHVDESQWTIAGQRISNDSERSRASEIIAENALELRSAGMRLILYAQDYRNIPPTARENMLFHILCRGASVSQEDSGKLAAWCKYHYARNPPSPEFFASEQGRFVFEENIAGQHGIERDSYPPDKPWKFALYPVKPEDREWCKRCRVRYVGKHDQKTAEDEIKEECLPELGRFSALAIPPDETDAIMYSRYDPGCIGAGEE